MISWTSDQALILIGIVFVYLAMVLRHPELASKTDWWHDHGQRAVRSQYMCWRNPALILDVRCGFGWALTLLPYGQIWRDARKAFHREFQPSAVPQYRPSELRETHDLLLRLLSAPEKFRSFIQLYVGGLRELFCCAHIA